MEYGADFTLAPARATDFERLFELRMRAMRESLERLGRFDMARGRLRFQASFRPDYTSLILGADSSMLGCIALGPRDGVLWLEHFYIEPSHTGSGLGRAVLARLLGAIDASGQPIKLDVLVGSRAQGFYARFGFVETHRNELDIFMTRPGSPTPATIYSDITY